MLEKEFHISLLITAELSATLTATQQTELDSWKKTSPDHLDFYNRLVAQENFLQEMRSFNNIETDHIWNLTKAGLKSSERTKGNLEFVKRNKFWPRIIAVAAAIAVIILGALYYSYNHQTGRYPDKSRYVLNAAADILPGRNGATLTLASGKSIKLSDLQSGVVIGSSQLAYNDGSVIATDAAQGIPYEKLTATTAKGQTYSFTLPDGSRVWLNADSRISFAQPFTDKTREVFLEGEAYFEVAKNKKRPFIVSGNGQFIEVLGTHFNVNAYPDGRMSATTLIEGSVKVSAAGKTQLIKPGEQVVNQNGKLNIRPADTDLELAWKNNDFYFRAAAMETVMKQIERWYNIRVEYSDQQLKSISINGLISRSKPLSVVLERLGAAGQMRFKIDGRTVTAMPL